MGTVMEEALLKAGVIAQKDVDERERKEREALEKKKKAEAEERRVQETFAAVRHDLEVKEFNEHYANIERLRSKKERFFIHLCHSFLKNVEENHVLPVMFEEVKERCAICSCTMTNLMALGDAGGREAFQSALLQHIVSGNTTFENFQKALMAKLNGIMPAMKSDRSTAKLCVSCCGRLNNYFVLKLFQMDTLCHNIASKYARKWMQERVDARNNSKE